MASIKTILLPSGRHMPVLGQGTWGMGEDISLRQEEVAALRTGLELGMTLIDTAETYADGVAESIVGEAVGNRRDEIFLVSKVLPSHATVQGTIEACEGSLQRLRTDYLDLYLLHWRGAIPLEETLEAFQLLKQAGKILDYGVSNFDVGDMEESLELSGGSQIVTNQVLYNLSRRGIELDLLPWCLEHKIPIMAYSPINHGGLLTQPILKKIALKHSATPAQIALAWVFSQKGVVAIPKASTIEHVKENHAAIRIKLTSEDVRELDEAFPPPTQKVSLEVL